MEQISMKHEQLNWEATEGNAREARTRFGHFKITADGDGLFTLWVDGREINMDDSIEAMKYSAQGINDGRRKEWNKKCRKEWSKKRFHAATAAMQGLMASVGPDARINGNNVAKAAIAMADELLRKLEETE